MYFTMRIRLFNQKEPGAVDPEESEERTAVDGMLTVLKKKIRPPQRLSSETLAMSVYSIGFLIKPKIAADQRVLGTAAHRPVALGLRQSCPPGLPAAVTPLVIEISEGIHGPLRGSAKKRAAAPVNRGD